MSDTVAALQDLLGQRYVVDREIGHGGMATVYLAHDIKHERQVAVKLLRPEIGALLGADRFLHEIKLTSRLQHPHILPLYDSGQIDGRIYYIMPFVAGESLRDRLRREKRLPVDAAVTVTREVADALAYAHGHGVVHRDIKPENILLSESHALVTDFGIARAISKSGGERWETLTSSGAVVGTPAYMSPEQAAGDLAIDGRSDIYSLGCVLYEMLVGTPPFIGPDGELRLVRRFTEPAPSVRISRPMVPERIAAVVAKALALDAADRYATAQELIDALAGHHVPVPARVPRWRTAFIPYMVAAIAAGFALWLTFSEREERAALLDQAVAEADTAPAPPRAEPPPVAVAGAGEAAEDSVAAERFVAPRPDPVRPAPDTARRARPTTIPPAALAAAMEVRRRASAAGASGSELAPGNAAVDSARALARRGRIDDALSRLDDATSSWIVAEHAAQARAAAIERQQAPAAPPLVIVPSPPVTASTTTVRTPPAPEDARAAIAAIIDGYAGAIETRTVAAIRRVYPSITAAQVRSWEEFFASIRQIDATLSITSLDQSGATATAAVAGAFDYVVTSGRSEHRPVSFMVTLRRERDGWRITAIR